MKTQSNTLLSRSVLFALSLSIPTMVSAEQVKLIATPKGAVFSTDMVQQKRSGSLEADIQPQKYTVDASEAEATIDELMATGEYISVEYDAPIAPPGFMVPLQFNASIESAESTVSEQSREFDGSVPNDPLFYIQYNWEDRSESTPTGMGFTRAWNLVESKERVVMAFVDGGYGAEGYSADFTPIESVSTIYLDNVERNGVILNSRPGDSAYSTDEEMSCEKSHGLGVAGIATANTNNDNQIAGIADNAYVDTIVIQATLCDTGLMSEMANGIRLAAGGTVEGIEPLSTKADIINVSLSSPVACSTYVQSAIDFAISQGSAVVVAAGNSNAPASDYSPANCEGVITVGGGTDIDTDLVSYSNYGSMLDIVARADSLVSLTVNDESSDSATYGAGMWSGTSFASPQVAATLAMAKTTSPSMSYDDMLSLLQLTATPMSGDKCTSVGCDEGLMNAGRFMLAVLGIENGDAGVITSSLGEGELCNPELYTMIDAVKARLCESTTVTLSNFVAPEHEDVTVRFMASPALETLTANNGQILYEGEELTFPISDIELEDVSYGYQLCHSGECEETIFPVKVDTEALALCD
jgi:hypothetical protein